MNVAKNLVQTREVEAALRLVELQTWRLVGDVEEGMAEGGAGEGSRDFEEHEVDPRTNRFFPDLHVRKKLQIK